MNNNKYGLCPFCGEKLTKGGMATAFKDGKRQRYYCRSCNRYTTKPNRQLELMGALPKGKGA